MIEEVYYFARGRYTKNIDRALPQRHSKRLDGSLGHEYSNILAQLRTGKARLNSYLHRINAVSTDCVQLMRSNRNSAVRLCQINDRTNNTLKNGEEAVVRHIILGGLFSEQLDRPRNRWISDLNAVKGTIAFAESNNMGPLAPQQNVE